MVKSLINKFKENLRILKPWGFMYDKKLRAPSLKSDINQIYSGLITVGTFFYLTLGSLTGSYNIPEQFKILEERHLENQNFSVISKNCADYKNSKSSN